MSPDADEHEFHQSISEQRLLRRVRWASIACALSFVVPYELVDGAPEFFWQVAGELNPASVVAAVSLSVLGVVLFLASLLGARPGNLALLVLGGLFTVVLLDWLGGEADAYAVLSLPGTSFRPGLVLLPFCLAGAGLPLVARAGTRGVGRKLLAGAALAGSGVYLIPDDGEIPALALFEVLRVLPQLPGFRFQLGLLLLLGIAALPFAVAVLAGIFSVWPPRREIPVLAHVITYMLPFAVAFLVLRELLLTFGSSSTAVTMVSIAPLAAVIAMATSSIEIVASGCLPALHWRWGVAGSMLAAGALEAFLALPPGKGIDWQLGSGSAELDELLGPKLERWNLARAKWLALTAHGGRTTATELLGMQKASRELLNSARETKPALSPVFESLTAESRSLDLAGRRWYRLIHELNEQSRVLGVPYYVDPSVKYLPTESGIGRVFDLSGYRIERVVPVSVEGRRFAVLHVRNLGRERSGHNLLGFSRDIQPFAVVVLNEIDVAADELEAWVSAEPARCFDIESDEALLEACGAKLKAALKGNASARARLTAATTRHELQHQIDGPGLTRPSALRRRMALYARWAQDRVNRELSAYLAELAAPRGSPAISLIQLLGFARLSAPRAELRHVAMLALAALAERELAAEADFEGEALARVYRELAALPDDELRSRGKRAWEKLYGRPLQQVSAE